MNKIVRLQCGNKYHPVWTVYYNIDTQIPNTLRCIYPISTDGTIVVWWLIYGLLYNSVSFYFEEYLFIFLKIASHTAQKQDSTTAGLLIIHTCIIGDDYRSQKYTWSFSSDFWRYNLRNRFFDQLSTTNTTPAQYQYLKDRRQNNIQCHQRIHA